MFAEWFENQWYNGTAQEPCDDGARVVALAESKTVENPIVICRAGSKWAEVDPDGNIEPNGRFWRGNSPGGSIVVNGELYLSDSKWGESDTDLPDFDNQRVGAAILVFFSPEYGFSR